MIQSHWHSDSKIYFILSIPVKLLHLRKRNVFWLICLYLLKPVSKRLESEWWMLSSQAHLTLICTTLCVTASAASLQMSLKGPCKLGGSLGHTDGIPAFRTCIVVSWSAFRRHSLYPCDTLAHNSSVSCIPKYLHSRDFVKSSPLIGCWNSLMHLFPGIGLCTLISQFEKRSFCWEHKSHMSQEGTWLTWIGEVIFS